MTELGYLAAFMVGLLGGGHCIGMCGGIVTGLVLGQVPTQDNTIDWPKLLAYNLGRITSYTAAGILVGGLGLWAAQLGAMHQARLWLQVVAGLFMLGLGLYLAGWWPGMARLERAGGLLWKHLEPLGRRLLPVRTTRQALALGLVWGWLPCGLVYSTLIWAISSGGALEGGLLMLSFGLGTLPTLLLAGSMAAHLAHHLRQPGVRAVSGLLVMSLGLGYLWLALTAINDLAP